MKSKSESRKVRKAMKIFRRMVELDPETVAGVMAWNSTALESDIPEDKELQKKYKDLLRRAKYD